MEEHFAGDIAGSRRLRLHCDHECDEVAAIGRRTIDSDDRGGRGRGGGKRRRGENDQQGDASSSAHHVDMLLQQWPLRYSHPIAADCRAKASPKTAGAAWLLVLSGMSPRPPKNLPGVPRTAETPFRCI